MRTGFFAIAFVQAQTVPKAKMAYAKCAHCLSMAMVPSLAKGVEIEAINFNSGNDALTALVSKSVDIAQVTYLHFVTGLDKGMDLVAVSGQVNGGSELLVGRLLCESGADVRYVGTACPRTRFSEVDRDWLEARGCRVQFRASLEQDLAAVEDVRPDLAIGTTPVVQKAKERAIPALYFTNLISARPLMSVAGAGSLAQVVNGAMAQAARFAAMRDFFAGIGEAHAAGIWEEVPQKRAAPKRMPAATPIGETA